MSEAVQQKAADEKNSELISGALGKLMSNPALLGNIMSALKNSGGGEPTAKAPEPKAEVQDKASEDSVPAVGNLFSSVPPELIAKLPLILSLMGGNGAAQSKEERDREALLCALKPYLTPERCMTIDKIIQVSRIGELLKNL